MAGRLSQAAAHIMGGRGLVARSVASSLRTRAGMGLPVGEHIVPDKPLPVNDELMWDNGTPFPEPCVDRIADTVGKYEALAWLCGGLGFFASLGLLAVWNDKASKIPYVSCKVHLFLFGYCSCIRLANILCIKISNQDAMSNGIYVSNLIN
nr:NADH dehydrogenase [ubiquinone] 1 beta subcomplex subunit 8, mitochondrial [Ipomoea batatas]